MLFRSGVALKGSSTTIETPRVLIANKELKAGNRVYFSDLELRSQNDLVNMKRKHFITDQELPLIQDKKLLCDVKKNEPLVFGCFSWQSDKKRLIEIPQGKRAVFLPTESLYWVEPGGKVDVVLNSLENIREQPLVIENVLVLSVEADKEPVGVTIAVSPEEIELIQTKLPSSRIALAIRNPKDKKRGGASNKGKHLFPKRVKVEVITEE